ncbi:DUF1538 domain-containing protein [Thalassotalea sp. PLHSN55]|uniref:DUF1538 domain-containing protein n=1 Tax=Thalassotalea sp. PLHSN55 TaxID=3435888 RepID=UPI003F840D2E
MTLLIEIYQTLKATVVDVLPILAILVSFQLLVIRQPIPKIKQVGFGFVYVLIGLSLFLLGLEKALFPLGKMMAAQLTAPEFIQSSSDAVHWQDYLWVYAFAATIGFSTTIAEPSLIAVALKAEEVSGGGIKANSLRIVVAFGVAIGIALGSYRIVVGDPIHYYIIAGYIVVVIQTWFCPKLIIPLAYDSGGVTTSTVTVPLVAALGIGLASTIPGRSPLIDGFGLIAFASLFPIIAVMGYAQITKLKSPDIDEDDDEYEDDYDDEDLNEQTK